MNALIRIARGHGSAQRFTPSTQRVATALSSAVLALALAGCAGGPAYVPQQGDGGYSESMRSDTEYIVRYDGNASVTQAAAEEMAMLRAAELTIEKGFPRFVIVDEKSTTDRLTSYVPTPSQSTGTVGRGGVFNVTTVGGGMMPVQSYYPRAMLRIQMVAADVSKSLDARRIAAELGPKYKPQK